MEIRRVIYQKLEAFIKKFYLNELIKGMIFFIGLGLLYFLVTLFIEYFLWLKPLGRTVLFWLFVIVELYLLLRFILFPIFKLFRLQKGMDYRQASTIIGNHFSEVNDKLTNFLQLSENVEQSELLIASIEQKAIALQRVPFGKVINFNRNQKYLPLAIIPILLFLFFYLSGNSTIISHSLNRVVHFNQQFLPPAPFQFIVINSNLQTEQNKDFVVRVKTEGKVVPENVMFFLNEESYFMESVGVGLFEFRITKAVENLRFHFEANDVSSPDYELQVVTVPSISNFEMLLNFPAYLNRKPELVRGSGNAIIPEGTRVTWKMSTIATQSIDWKEGINTVPFVKAENSFVLSKNVIQNTEYQILTSNNQVKNHEKLNYQLSVIKDQYPSIDVKPAPDSLKVRSRYVIGQIADDYGLSKLQIVYYERGKPHNAKRGTIASSRNAFDQFVFAFPSNLPVVEGVSYDYYFEVFDNDALHHFKSARSSVFSDRVATVEEKEDQILQQQNDNINSLEKSLKSQDRQLSEIDKLQKIGKEKDNFEFKDQQKVDEFVKRQKQQDQMMQEFAKKMKSDLDKFNSESKEELQKRLEKVDKDLEKNEKLLDELQKLNDKIDNEELLKKLDNFKQSSKNQTRTLEQLVELTKKFYVEQKAEQVADKLEKLSEKQSELSEKERENNLENQEEINKAFDKIQEELDELEKENKELKSPLDLPKEDLKEKSIDEDLKKAGEELQKSNRDKARPKQKNASKKMMEISMKMKESMEASESEQMEEDVKMLRQILDNLLAFSLSQENVMGQFKSLKAGSPSFNKYIKQQQNLKQQFKHVDDSLFAISLRNPKIAESVTKEIGNIEYNIDKSLETLSDAQISKGLSHQQYTVSSANKLADLLSDTLSNMQMSMSGMGMGKPKPGQGQGMQLPDIIKKQQGLGEKMKDGIKKGEKPGADRPGQQEKEGKGTGEGGDSEGDAKAIMEIYKEQKQLREALEKELNKQGLGGNGQSTLEQMKQIEKQLLNKGFKNETLQKIIQVEQELLKLNTAIQEQGEENKRQSETNKKEFYNHSNALPPALLDYLNSIEILNRQSLPLRSNFNQKVQEYFNKK
ncbi:hypothetical protein D3C84_185380 [compost metagenome]